ncbi:hypothetical protein H4R26_003678 [Coemansia thaxteri]|uniref:Uncharacterized protein n=1 Tax=Coemansia thaxteri TaxID=2663907 RepID=A0A9W8BHK5_9FUNG|nr:hypothetical protein H4R26_003678 [Coemansia thaxteri]
MYTRAHAAWSEKPQASPGSGGEVAAMQATLSEYVSPTKKRTLKCVRRRCVAWLAVELFFLVTLLALLVLHSFRLSRNTHDNTYARWSSSWVMILLSVLLVVVAMAVFVTYYYFRTMLAWIRDPETTDAALLSPRSRDAHRVGWQFLRPRRPPGSQQTMPSVPAATQGNPRQYNNRQAPWASLQGGRNSRAWRQLRAQQRRRHHTDSSSITISASSLPSRDRVPRRPPPVL